MVPLLLLSAGLISAATDATNETAQPYFPVFHVRPPAGHVNDPNVRAELALTGRSS